MLNGEQREGQTLKSFSLVVGVSAAYNEATGYMSQWHWDIWDISHNSVSNFRDREKVCLSCYSCCQLGNLGLAGYDCIFSFSWI